MFLKYDTASEFSIGPYLGMKIQISLISIKFTDCMRNWLISSSRFETGVPNFDTVRKAAKFAVKVIIMRKQKSHQTAAKNRPDKHFGGSLPPSGVRDSIQNQSDSFKLKYLCSSSS